MTNLLTVVPDFNAQAFSHIIPSLEKNGIATADLLTIDAVEIARRARVPAEEVRRLTDVLRRQLRDGDWLRQEALSTGVISLLDDELDQALNGGIRPGYVTEIAGESAVGKTQYLLTLLLSVQLPAPLGLDKNALYLSTEAQLSTKRLAQILFFHPRLEDLAPSLDRVHSTHIRDLEAQEHVLRYQVPVIIKRHNIGLVIVDSIAANYRAEIDRSNDRRAAESVAQRSAQIGRIGAHLRALARTMNVAIVLANQVADRFETVPAYLSQSTQRSQLIDLQHAGAEDMKDSISHKRAVSDSDNIEPAAVVLPSIDSPLDLDHQQRFFTGWGDNPAISSPKNPSLGLTWTCQLATRIVLLKSPVYDEYDHSAQERVLTGWQRRMKVVFGPWAPPSETDFEIWQGGVRALRDDASEGHDAA